MTRNRETALYEIQQLSFKMYDIALFLDTHPDEASALTEYALTIGKYNSMVKNYEKLYGPLTINNTDECNAKWNWINGPWPWENDTEEVCK